ncbi:MAG: metallophosphoesterase [Bacteroidia bacterium]|nr:metallophosphoesterase [Bacteroidia bacterium]MDW8014609.1 metallophosphoesterase [Bacteroidia bacterium]
MASDLVMRWIFLLGLWLVAEIGGFYGLRRIGLWRRWMGWITPLTFGAMVVIFLFTRSISLSPLAYGQLQYIGGIFFMVWLMLLLGKLVGGLWGLLSNLPLREREVREFSPGRRAALQMIGGMLMSAPAAGLGYGFWIGRYRFRMEEIEIGIPTLPPSWDGTLILHFSDLHAGSFSSPHILHPVWEKVKMVAPHLIVFTGDWVNTFAEELEPFLPDLHQLSAPLGKWTVLGNHDYGDYIPGATPEEKAEERAKLRFFLHEAGFSLLENDAVLLEKAGERIALVGVGNWSYWRRFRRYGDLRQAWQKVPPGICSLLLSHDPTHWEYEVCGKYPIPLTLSGHTHGLQMGVEGAGWRFSPAQWLYTYWAGLYQVGQQYLYVNRGLGCVGLPARLGIWPEITLLRLRCSSDSV